MNYDEVKELISIFEKTDLNDMEVQLDNAVVRLNRGSVSPWSAGQTVSNSNGAQNIISENSVKPKQNDAVEAAAGSTSSDKNVSDDVQEEGRFIKAPIVGTFYQSAAPDKPPYVSVGDSIAKGDVVCIIEAMKFMNEVNSEESGKIVEILVKDGDFVEFGQPLFRVE